MREYSYINERVRIARHTDRHQLLLCAMTAAVHKNSTLLHDKSGFIEVVEQTVHRVGRVQKNLHYCIWDYKAPPYNLESALALTAISPNVGLISVWWTDGPRPTHTASTSSREEAFQRSKSRSFARQLVKWMLELAEGPCWWQTRSLDHITCASPHPAPQSRQTRLCGPLIIHESRRPLGIELALCAACSLLRGWPDILVRLLTFSQAYLREEVRRAL